MQCSDSGASVRASESVPYFLNGDFDESSGLSTLPALKEVERLVEQLVASWHASNQVLQRRRWHRIQYRKPLLLTPLDAENKPAVGTFVVMGRDVSVGGISFNHRQPIVEQWVAITLPFEDGSLASVVTRLTWCRFTSEGQYLSGGQFLRGIALPSELTDWNSIPTS